MIRAREGDLDAFEQLVHEHTPAAYRLATAIVGESLARDLVQDAFLAAWRQLPRLRDPERFAPWLHRIVVNRGRSMLRSGRSVREIPVTPVHEATLAHAPDGLAAAEARVVVAAAFSALTLDQRTVVSLHYAAGLSLSEVADVLEVPVGTAKSRLAAALEALRRRVGVADR